MIIVSAIDERFVPHFATMLHSAWFHNREAEFYLIDSGIAQESQETLTRFAAKLDTRLTIAKIDTELFADFPISAVWSVAVYTRLLIASILPDTYEQAIYLDADCIVTSDLSPLWETDMSSFLIAGVADNSAAANERRQCGIGNLSDYINAGVMLINLRAWREEKFADVVIAHLRGHNYLYGEQTAINVIASGRIKTIPETWNFMLHKIDVEGYAPISPCIIHCTGFRKPWLHRDAPLAPIYLHHRNSTPYPIKDPENFYPSTRHYVLSLLALRRKYWRRLMSSRRFHRAFTIPYLKSVSNMPKPAMPD